MDIAEHVVASIEMCWDGKHCNECFIGERAKEEQTACLCYKHDHPEEFAKYVEKYWKKHKPKTNYEWYEEWFKENGFKTTFLRRDVCPPTNKYGSCEGRDCDVCKKWWDKPHEEKK